MRSIRLALLFLLLAACGLVACSHGFDGPTPSITKASPPVVCNQLDTLVTLTGSGFNPTPVNDLRKSRLDLPKVSLVDAQGNAHPVDPNDVTWTSQTSMAFWARASQALAPGVYDIVVENRPTGKQGRLAAGLTIVPPPTLTAVVPSAICDQLTTTVTLTGTNFRTDPANGSLDVTIGATTFTQTSGAVVFVDPQTVTVTIPMGFPDGVWDVTLKNPEGCKSTLPGALTVLAPPTIASVTPPSVWNGQDTTITIAGTGFRTTPTAGPTVTLSMGTAAPITLAMVTLVDAQTVTAVVPQGTPVGTYVLTLTNPEGCFATATLIVTATPPIGITSIINPFGCASQDTAVTINGMGFISTPTATLVGAGPGGTDLNLKNVAFVSSTKLTGIIPLGGVIGGPYTLRVINPDGALAEKAMAFTITKICPPVISNVDPNSVVHDYSTQAPGSTPITIDGTNFGAGAQVVLVNQAGMEITLPGATVTVNASGTQIILQFNASMMNLADGVYLVRVKTTDAPVSSGGTGATMYGDYSLFIVTNPAGKFLPAQASKMLPEGRRGHGVIGAQATAAARFLYVIAGDSGGAAPTLFANGYLAALDMFGNIGDLGWQPLRKRAVTPTTGDTLNNLPTARTGVAVAEVNGWVYVVGGSTALTASVPDPTKLTPTADIRRAHLLPLADVPTVTGGGAGGGTVGTYYYKVSTLVAAGTPGYGPNPAETLASDEVVVQVGAQGSVQLSITNGAGLPGASVTGYRIYRTKMVDGTSQTEEFLADVTTTSATATFVDTFSATAGGAHPLQLGTLSEWEPSGTLLVPRAYPLVSVLAPQGGSVTDLYVVGGVSSSGTVEKTWEFAPIDTATGVLSAFGPTGLTSNGCAVAGETCMSVGRWSLYGGPIEGPPNVTTRKWIFAGVGAPAPTDEVQEHAEVLASGLLDTWAPIATFGGGAFTGDPRTLGPIGFYTNGHIAFIDGFVPSTGQVSNKDEFGTEACTTALISGSCPATSDFQQVAKSNSTLNVTPSVAWSGFTLTNGFIYIVGGSTDGSNAVTDVQQGAQ